jgi:hypothetical protein
MNKSTKIITITVIILITLLIFFLFLNRDNLDRSKHLYDGQIIEIVHMDDVFEYDFERIESLKEYSFNAFLNESGKEPVEKEYTGVLLKDILRDLNINDYSALTISAVDGYTVIIDKEKIEQDDNVYLTYKQDGKWLKSREEGGVGPFQMVIAKDQFSQYWCKYVTKIEVVD